METVVPEVIRFERALLCRRSKAARPPRKSRTGTTSAKTVHLDHLDQRQVDLNNRDMSRGWPTGRRCLIGDAFQGMSLANKYADRVPVLAFR